MSRRWAINGMREPSNSTSKRKHHGSRIQTSASASCAICTMSGQRTGSKRFRVLCRTLQRGRTPLREYFGKNRSATGKIPCLWRSSKIPTQSTVVLASRARNSQRPPPTPNRGIPLNLDRIQQVRVNTSAGRTPRPTHTTRRSVKKDFQAAWILRAITCMA